jgi:hypothetical protein
MEQGAWSKERNASEKLMRQGFFGMALGPWPFALCLVEAILFALSVSAQVQQSAKIPRIGF